MRVDSLPKIQQLTRDKSVLVLHIAELRTEKRNLEISQRDDSKEAIVNDDIDYSALIEKYIDDQEILDLIPKIVQFF